MSLGLSDEEATATHRRLYRDYGLSVRGAAYHYGIDPLDFDSKCDGSLPLEELLKSNPETRTLLSQIDRRKVRVWALTNAYKTHADRVLKILKLEDLFEGCIYCKYDQPNFPCKPEAEFYQAASDEVGINDPSKILFIDDSLANVQGAKKMGWGNCVWFKEGAQPDEQSIPDVDTTINDLEHLREIWSWIFVEAAPNVGDAGRS